MAGNQGYDVSNDTIFITGLPEDMNEEQLAEHFGQIGVIKYDKKNDCKKIWIYKDKTTGKAKGEATITYDDPPTATSAINWFDGKEFRGSILKVELAQRKSAPQYGRGGGNFRGARGGGSGGGRGGGFQDRGGRPPGGSGRPGDWLCPTCNNNNFAYRQECNRCKTQKPPSAGGNDGTSGGSHYNGSRHYDDNSRGNYGARSGSSGGGYRDNDLRDRGGRDRHNPMDRDRGRDRDRDSYRDRDRDQRDRGNRGSGSYGDRGGSNGGDGSGGPSRSHHMRDDRRQRPY